VTPIYRSAGIFATRFAKLGLLLGGAVPFYIGYTAFNPPQPLEPNETLCGNYAMGGLCIMIFGTPFGALVGAVAGWFIGTIFESKRNPYDSTQS
jgi:membrane protein YqaA with SNARE-associated domain